MREHNRLRPSRRTLHGDACANECDEADVRVRPGRTLELLPGGDALRAGILEVTAVRGEQAEDGPAEGSGNRDEENGSDQSRPAPAMNEICKPREHSAFRVFHAPPKRAD